MAQYSGTEAYDFSLFEDEAVSLNGYSSAAPVLPDGDDGYHGQKRTVPSHKKNPNRAPAPGTVRPAVKAAVAVLMSVLVVLGAGILLNRRAAIDDMASKINDLNKQITLEKSDHVRLSSAIDSMFSKREVETYAENVLGMVKLDHYNTIQITLPRTDSVVISAGKSADEGMVRKDNPLTSGACSVSPDAEPIAVAASAAASSAAASMPAGGIPSAEG